MSDTVSPLTFGEFVDTTDSEQRWQIYNAIAGTGGVAENVNIVGPVTATGKVATGLYDSLGNGIFSTNNCLNVEIYDSGGSPCDNGAGAIQTVTLLPGTIYSGQAVASSSTGSTLLFGTHAITQGIVLTNGSTTIPVYIGAIGVTTSTGYSLAPGASLSLPVNSTTQVYAVTASSSATIYWIAS
jgi:hypothetical protein